MGEREQVTSDERAYVKCPFCGEDDFDLWGLKMHLIRWCDVYDQLKQPPELAQRGELKV